jgi:hypothetical protein
MAMHRPALFVHAAHSFLLGLGIFLLGVALEFTLHKMRVSGTWELFDNVCTGIMAGLLVFFYERQRHKRVERQLRMIADMNHHVRNALQSITYAPYIPSQIEQISVIRSSVERIQWALREILTRDIQTHPFIPSPGEDKSPGY